MYRSNDYGYNYNNNSNQRFRWVAPVTCGLLIAGALSAGIYGITVGVKNSRARRAESARVQNMIESTASQASLLKEICRDSNCDTVAARFDRLLNGDNSACTNATTFAEGLFDALDDCFEDALNQDSSPLFGLNASQEEKTDNANKLEGQISQFLSTGPEQAKEGETFHSITCQYNSDVAYKAALQHQVNCFREGFTLAQNITDFVDSLEPLECTAFEQASADFMSIAKSSCDNASLIKAAAEQCSKLPPELSLKLDRFINPNFRDNCHKTLCEVKDELDGVEQVSYKDDRGIDRHTSNHMMMYWFLMGRYWGAPYGGRGVYTKPISYTTRDKNTGTRTQHSVSGRTSFRGGGPIRGASGRPTTPGTAGRPAGG